MSGETLGFSHVSQASHAASSALNPFVEVRTERSNAPSYRCHPWQIHFYTNPYIRLTVPYGAPSIEPSDLKHHSSTRGPNLADSSTLYETLELFRVAVMNPRIQLGICKGVGK